MANNNRDINLVIRARDEAKNKLNGIATAFRQLLGEQEDFSKSAEKVSTASGRLGRQFEALRRQLQSNPLFEKAAEQMGAAINQIARLETTVRKTASAAAQSAVDYKKASAATEELALKSKLTADALTKEQAAFKASKTELSKINAEVRKAETAYNSLFNKIAKAKAPSEELNASYRKQRDALIALHIAQEKAIADHNRNTVALKEAKIAHTQIGAAFAAAEKHQAGLQKQTTSTTGALSTQISEIRKLKAEMANISGLGARAFSQTRPTAGPSAAEAVNDQWKLRDAIRQTGVAAEKAAGGARGWAAAIQASSNSSRSALSIAQRLRGEVLSLTTSYLGLFAAINQTASVVKAFQAVEAVQNRLGAVFNQNTTRVGQEVDFLRNQAIRLGISFEVLGDEYSKLSVAAKEANFAQEETRRLFLSVAEAGRVNKLSIENMRGIFLALTQMISKGKINSEELTRQLGDRLPGAVNIFAGALGVSTSKLFEMMKAGEVFANRKTMLAAADALNDRFGKQLPSSLDSLTSQIGRFQAIMFDLKVQVGEAGFAEALRVAINDLNKSLQNPEGREFVQAISDALSALVKVFTVFIKNFDVFLAGLKIFTSFKLAEMLVGVTASLLRAGDAFKLFAVQALAAGTAAKASFVAMTASAAAAATGISRAGVVVVGSFRAILTAIRALLASLGPVGLAFLAVSAAMEALGFWVGKIDDATKSLEQHDDMLTKVREAYRKSRGEVKAWAEELKSLTPAILAIRASEIQQQLDEVRDSVRAPVNGFGNDDPTGTVPALKKAVDAFRAGTLSAEEFRREVSRIKEADPKLQDGIVLSLTEAGDKAKIFEERLAQVNATIRVSRGEATEQDKALLGVAESADEAASGVDTVTEATEKQKRATDKLISALEERRQLLMSEIEFQENQGNAGAADALRARLEEANQELLEAIPNAIKFWEAVGGIEAENKVLTLERLRQQIQATGETSKISGKQINDLIVSGGTNAFDQFAQSIANGENAIDGLRNAFLQFAADFLREIAQMILKQAILNAMGASATGGGGIGGGIAGFISGLFHDGGIAGQATRGRAANPAWFANAVRYHSGGIAGLKPNEVPAILERGEEILTSGDPRHIANGGGGKQDIKVINAIDPGSFVSAGMNTKQGEQAVMNFMRANASAIKTTIGVK